MGEGEVDSISRHLGKAEDVIEKPKYVKGIDLG